MMVAAGVLGATLLGGAEGSRIVTMPTAHLLSAGSICASYFWADLDVDNPRAPQSMSIGILGVGLTPSIEVDLTYLGPEGASGMKSVGVECLVSRETLGQPAVALGADTLDAVKALTRCGMGNCQGRVCGQLLAALVARETGRARAEVGQFRVRPPIFPIPLADLQPISDEGTASVLQGGGIAR